MKTRILAVMLFGLALVGCEGSDYEEFWDDTGPDCRTVYRNDPWSPTGIRADTECRQQPRTPQAMTPR